MAPATHPGNDKRPDGQSRSALLIGTALLVIFCLGCCGVGLAVSSSSANVQMGYVVQACVGVNMLPHIQLGVTWISPYMSVLAPVLLQHQACAPVPWLPFLPQRGGFAFP